MKNLLLVLSLSIVGCASNSTSKSGGKSMEAPTKEAATQAVKEEAKKAVTKEMKKSAPMAKKVESKARTVCTYGENERVIENRTADSGGCEVVYTKEGNPDIVANAQNALDYCQEVADRIVGKLTSAGFKCE